MYLLKFLRSLVLRTLRDIYGRFTAKSLTTNNCVNVSAKQRALEVVRLLQNDNFEELRKKFVAPLRVLLTVSVLQKGWSIVRRGSGPIVHIGDPVISAGWFVTIKVPIQFKYASLAMVLQTTTNGGIFGLRFLPKTSAGFLVDWRQPPYVDPTSIIEVELQVGSTYKSPGTLTLPRDGTRCACIILLSGSGPCDQDSTVGSIKPFKDIAQGLACAGIATIRFDKVTLAHPRRWNKSTMTLTDEYMDQAISAVVQAQAHDRIATENTFILGHSLGAVIAPKVAEYFSGLVSGVILMAAPARPLYRCAIDQMKYLGELRASDGASASDQEESENEIRQLEAAVALADKPELSRSTSASLLPFGIGAPYWLDYRTYMPMQTARELGKPLLVLQGGRDYQVTLEHDYTSWRNALEGHFQVSLKVFTKLNHLFVPGEGLASPQEYETPGNVDLQVLEEITRWVEATST